MNTSSRVVLDIQPPPSGSLAVSDRIQVACNQCSTTLGVPASAEGKHVRCPKCTHVFAVPVSRPVAQVRVVPAPVKARRAEDSPPPKKLSSSQKPAPKRKKLKEPEEFPAAAWDTAYQSMDDIPSTGQRLPPRRKKRSSDPDSAVVPQEDSGVADRKEYRQTVGNHLLREIQRGGRFVQFSYAISLIRITFQFHTSAIYIPPGGGTALRSLPYTLITILLGWWGIPWGPIYSVGAILTNVRGGVDVTDEVLRRASHSASGDPNRKFWS